MMETEPDSAASVCEATVQPGKAFTIPAKMRVATWKRWVFQALALVAMPFLLATRFAHDHLVMVMGICLSLTGIIYLVLLAIEVRNTMKRHGSRLYLSITVRQELRSRALRLWATMHWPTVLWLAAWTVFFLKNRWHPTLLILVVFWLLVNLWMGLALLHGMLHTNTFLKIVAAVVLPFLIVSMAYLASDYVHSLYKQHSKPNPLHEETLALYKQLHGTFFDYKSLKFRPIPCGMDEIYHFHRYRRVVLEIESVCYSLLFGNTIIGVAIGYAFIRRP